MAAEAGGLTLAYPLGGAVLAQAARHVIDGRRYEEIEEPLMREIRYLDKLVDDALNDTQMLTACRSPSYDELRRLFTYVYDGQQVDF